MKKLFQSIIHIIVVLVLWIIGVIFKCVAVKVNKIMEQIDYKKKYEEAIERAKEIIKDYETRSLNDIVFYAKEDLAAIFPELKESEDEKNIDFLIHLIEHNVPNHSFAFGDGCAYGYKSKEEAINMLKSISSQSNWKPSDEQMVVLNDIIINGHLSNANERILKGLQEQLKKLREE